MIEEGFTEQDGMMFTCVTVAEHTIHTNLQNVGFVEALLSLALTSLKIDLCK